jgi:hypothetical protein
LKQGLLLKPISLPAQPLDPIAVYRLFEMPAAGPKTCLQRSLPRRRLEQPPNFKRKERKTLSFPKNPLDPLPALEFFLSFPGKLTVNNTYYSLL